MEYLHTMIRVADLDKSMNFYCNHLGMMEVNRIENQQGRFTLIFLAADNDAETAKESKSPVIELTYNWPDENGNQEKYGPGRNFGHLAYSVDNIYETCARLQEVGITINRPPRDGFMAFIKSPDDISIEILQKGKALPSQEPWASMQNTGTW